MRRDDEGVIGGRWGAWRERGALKRSLMRGMIAVSLLAVGVAGGVVWSERRGANSGAAPKATAAAAAQGARSAVATQSEEPVEVSLTPEALERAGIKTALVQSQPAVSAMTVPGTVMSNAYRDTKVNALIGGVIRRVSAELGSPVTRGQPLAVIFSTDLAEAQMKYLSMQAMAHADRQKRERTEKLVALGAASRQELEEITAVQASRETELAAARQRLLLLGLSADQVTRVTDASHIVSEVIVPAPADGIVIARNVNPGQVVMAGHDLFVVTDLSTVWVIGDLYEKDFASVGVGSEATVGVPSAPKSGLGGRVAYIDPRVDPATRTAKVRVEVPNRNAELRLGMYVTVSFQTGSAQRQTLVPRTAVQSVGDRTVVYVPVEGEETRFTERPVKVAAAVGEFLQVLEGLKPGEKVVTEGSFFLRAEAARTRSGG